MKRTATGQSLRSGAWRAPSAGPRSLRALRALGLVLAGAVLWLAGVDSAAGRAPVRFDPQAEVVWRVADDQPIPLPEPRRWNELREYVDDHWLRPIDALLAVRGRTPARDLNALDAVPASSWFHRRPHARATAAPEPPFVVEAARIAGPEPIAWVRDRDGHLFLLACDLPGHPEARSAAAVIAAHLLDVAGYHVPATSIVHVGPEAWQVADEAVAIGEYGGRGRLTGEAWAEFHRGAELRAAAGALPAGVRLGGFPEAGVRGDDAHDRIAHEDRRSLRGLALFAAWLDHVALDEAHTLDLYLEAEHHVRHYLVGLGSTLGTLRAGPPPSAAQDFAPWSLYASAGFDPLAWQTRQPYAPFVACGWGDIAWGLRRLLAIDATQIRAAVAAAHLSDPDRADYLVGALLARRDRIARAWLARINGLSDLRVEEVEHGRFRLACNDVGLAHGYKQAEDVYAVLRAGPAAGGVRGAVQTRGGANLTFDLVPFAPPDWAHRLDPRRYVVVALDAWDYRGRQLVGTIAVHLYFDPSSAPRIVGIIRD